MSISGRKASIDVGGATSELEVTMTDSSGEEIPQCVFERGHKWIPIVIRIDEGKIVVKARQCRICGHEVDKR